MGRSASHLPGSVHLELVEGVVHLEPERAVFEAMLQGWARQQQARFLKEDDRAADSAGPSHGDLHGPVPVAVAAW